MENDLSAEFSVVRCEVLEAVISYHEAAAASFDEIGNTRVALGKANSGEMFAKAEIHASSAKYLHALAQENQDDG